jgi:hypothetical protein
MVAVALCVVLGVALVLWSVLGTAFRDTEGFLTGSFGMPLAGGLTLLLLAWSIRVGALAFGCWTGLLMVGQAATLQLIEAGTCVCYQHLRAVEQLGQASPVVLGVVVLQAAAVAVGIFRLLPTVLGWLRRTFALWQLLVIASLFALTSAALSSNPILWVTELGLATTLQLLHLTTVVLAARFVPEVLLERVGRWGLFDSEDYGTQYLGLDRVAIVSAAVVMAVAAVLSLVVYDRHPHIPDEVSYLYQARYFAAGMLTMPLPPVPEAINLDLMYYAQDRWFSPLPLGWAGVLALGSLVGVPWLVNPVLAGVAVLLTFSLVRYLYGQGTARLTVLLLAASPWFLFLAMSFMTHTLTLVLALGAAVATCRVHRDGGVGWALIGGAAIGGVSLVRPLEGLALAAILSLVALTFRGWKAKVLTLLGLGIGAAALGGLMLPYNAALTGDPLRFPLMEYTTSYYGPLTNALGFGPERGLGWFGLDPFPGHGLRDVLVNAALNGFSVNIELFGWATGSVLVLAAIVFAGPLRRADVLMVGVVGGIVGIHSLYWFSGGPDFGARYWYLIVVPCVVLTVRGVHALQQRLGQAPSGSRVRPGIVVVAALLLTGSAVVTYLPWRSADKYHHYRGMRPGIRVLERENGFGQGVVLVQGERWPDYSSAAIYNPLDLDGDGPIYAWDQGPVVRGQLVEAYPQRPFWIVAGPTVTGTGFEILAGPLTSSEVVADR